MSAGWRESLEISQVPPLCVIYGGGLRGSETAAQCVKKAICLEALFYLIQGNPWFITSFRHHCKIVQVFQQGLVLLDGNHRGNLLAVGVRQKPSCSAHGVNLTINRRKSRWERTKKLSDHRWKRAQAVSDDVHESKRFKTETLGGGSSPPACSAS
jgi:hypothetical protein